MYFESRRSINGVEIVPGAQLPVHSNLGQQPVTIIAVCESVSPDRWRADLSLFGQTLITTDTFGDPYDAGRAAEAALISKLVKLLKD